MKAVYHAWCFACITLAFAVLAGCDGKQTYVIKSKIIKVDSLDQIVAMHDSLVCPILYTNITGLEHLPLHQAKRKFISAILPSILVAKHEIHNRKTKVTALRDKKIWNNSDSAYYAEMKRKYNAKNIDDLLNRMVTLPNSVVLAQAAIETGWGESRFFVQASNLFGIWSFNDQEARIAAGKNRNDKTIFLRSYDDMSRSISDYFEVLARHNAYKGLRSAHQRTNDPYKLVTHLRNYSERKGWYTRQLRKVIRQNNLTRYDRYRIDPDYLELE
ncbi:glucosaminidase domain-containing protein [Chryseolinea sp. H1M3-3]|jgi:Bax protein|uniref:glucosaminidase domain-containing protein n=1 Tax=Chryseolinea sp. H1M3-3 TaxID=3034144 RepID=UPI0023ED5056|nr:glucosaminidase domain-containing protein [Chryseolinea sp. H1M3-3]